MQLRDLLDEHRIPVMESGHHHNTVGWLQLDCPFCSPNSGKWRLGYNLAGRFFSCWTCGSHRAADTLAALLNEPLPVCLKLLGQVEGERRVQPKHRGRLVLPKGLTDLLPAHRRYLQARGLDPETVSRLWGLRGIGQAVRLSWRIWLPVQQRGSIVSWTTRALHDRGARYHSARPEEEAVPLKTLLYGEDLARHAAIICEGPFDCLRIGPGAVATLGVVLTRAQVLKLARFPLRVVCLDNEPEAQRRARSLCDELSVFPGKTLNVQLDSAKDAGAASTREIRQLRRLLD